MGSRVLEKKKRE